MSSVVGPTPSRQTAAGAGTEGQGGGLVISRLRDLVLLVLAFATDLILSGYGIGDGLVTGPDRSPAPALVVMALVAVMAASLLLRWRHPLGVLTFTIAMSTALSLWMVDAQPVVCWLIALYAAAKRSDRRRAWLALALGLAGALMTMLSVARSAEEHDLLTYLFPGVFFSLLVLGVWAVARREQAAQHRADALSAQLHLRAEQATQAERRRIARDLHDIVAHSVSAMMMQAAGARALAQTLGRDRPEDGRVQAIQESLGTIEATGSQSMRELHRLLGAMHDAPGSSSLDLGEEVQASDLPGLGMLDSLIETPRRSGLIVEVHRTGTPGELDPSVDTAAYRTVQEALTNSLKHGGRGAVVDVYESWTADSVQVQVRCRGSLGANLPGTPHGGTGLRGLRERVELAGGTFEAGWVGDEFVTTAVLPAGPGDSENQEGR